MKWVHTMNEKVADSFVGRYFELKGRKSTFSTGQAGHQIDQWGGSAL